MTDEEKALLIAKSKPRYVGKGGTMHLFVAEAVLDGIRWGREQGLKQASALIESEVQKVTNAPRT